MKDILIITNYCQFPNETGNSRYITIANEFYKRGYNVEIIASSFYHKTKKQRVFKSEDVSTKEYKVTLIHEPGYARNICLKRLKSSKVLSKNIMKYLAKRKIPDLIYCPTTPLDIASKVSDYCKKNKIPFIIDIQDLWPEAFKMVLNIPIISDIIFYPMTITSRKIYKMADAIVAVSDTYVNHALKFNKKVSSGLPVYLGTDIEKFDEYAKNSRIERNAKIFNIAYIGTLGKSYDINKITLAISNLKKQGIENIKFLVIGDGPSKEEFIKFAQDQGINTEFTGMLSYENMVQRLVKCDIAVNPIISTSEASIINKVGDYAAAGLPVINTQRSVEYRQLIDEYEAGINCDNLEDIERAIKYLKDNQKVCFEKGANNRRLGIEKFDRKSNYKKIGDLINNILEDKLMN